MNGRRVPRELLDQLALLAPALARPASGRELARRVGRHPADQAVALALRDLVATGALRRAREGYHAVDAVDREEPVLTAVLADGCRCPRPLPGYQDEDTTRCLKCGREVTGR